MFIWKHSRFGQILFTLNHYKGGVKCKALLIRQFEIHILKKNLTPSLPLTDKTVLVLKKNVQKYDFLFADHQKPALINSVYMRWYIEKHLITNKKVPDPRTWSYKYISLSFPSSFCLLAWNQISTWSNQNLILQVREFIRMSEFVKEELNICSVLYNVPLSDSEIMFTAKKISFHISIYLSDASED